MRPGFQPPFEGPSHFPGAITLNMPGCNTSAGNQDVTTVYINHPLNMAASLF